MNISIFNFCAKVASSIPVKISMAWTYTFHDLEDGYREVTRTDAHIHRTHMVTFRDKNRHHYPVQVSELADEEFVTSAVIRRGVLGPYLKVDTLREEGGW